MLEGLDNVSRLVEPWIASGEAGEKPIATALVS
jgi:hypothetical protein